MRQTFIVLFQGGLILESFSRGSNLPKIVPNTIVSVFFFRWIELRIMIWEIGAKVNNFLRLNNLYLATFNSTLSLTQLKTHHWVDVIDVS